jgi:hypothetical protein
MELVDRRYFNDVDRRALHGVREADRFVTEVQARFRETR